MVVVGSVVVLVELVTEVVGVVVLVVGIVGKFEKKYAPDTTDAVIITPINTGRRIVRPGLESYSRIVSHT